MGTRACNRKKGECREGQPRAYHSGHSNQATLAPAGITVVFPTPCTYSSPLPFLTSLPEPPAWAPLPAPLLPRTAKRSSSRPVVSNVGHMSHRGAI